MSGINGGRGYGNSAYGATAISYGSVSDSALYSFDKITFYGQNTGVSLAKILGKNEILYDEVYNGYVQNNYFPEWDENTYMLVDLKYYDSVHYDVVDAGNMIGLTSALDSWALYRESQSSDVLELVGEYDPTTTDINDYTVMLNEYYTYYLFAKGNNQMSAPLATNQVKASYDGYFLIDVENNISYKINIFNSGGDKVYNRTYQQYETNTTYPLFTLGQSKYISGDIGGLLLSNVDDLESNTVELLNQFKEFISSNRLKYFKNRKGEIFNVFIGDYSESLITQGVPSSPYLCTFSYVEIGRV